MAKRKGRSLVIRIIAFGNLNPLSKFNQEIAEAGGILVEVSVLEKMYPGKELYRIKGNLLKDYPQVPHSSRGFKYLQADNLIDEKHAYIDGRKKQPKKK
jgi:hypothetical protein